MKKSISILGTRGIPARHGGFETFAEKLALYLVSIGWEVTVYCQRDEQEVSRESCWRDVRLVEFPSRAQGAWGTIQFDWESTCHASREDSLKLTLGYNTAIFCLLYRLRRKTNLINMDGIEWQRAKWKWHQRAWLWFNERIGCYVGDHLIADHPEIKRHLATRIAPSKISVIPYGADLVGSANEAVLHELGLQAHEFCLVIARPEPENSILTIVRAFSEKRRNKKLVVLGAYAPSDNEYHRLVIEAASEEVVFPGAIYDEDRVNALRASTCLYIHGHTVGGTNPSLVEAMGAGAPVLAHDNRFNRWVAGEAAAYFTPDNLGNVLDTLLGVEERQAQMSHASIDRVRSEFSWGRVLSQYEDLLTRWLPAKDPA